jgi:hypothetical protein
MIRFEHTNTGTSYSIILLQLKHTPHSLISPGRKSRRKRKNRKKKRRREEEHNDLSQSGNIIKPLRIINLFQIDWYLERIND